MTEYERYLSTVRAEQATKAAEFLAKTCQYHNVSPADILAKVGDFDAHWVKFGKNPSTVFGIWVDDIRQALPWIKRGRDLAGVMAARDEYARKNGGTTCKRCSGAGGASQWPGFVCYDCGGKGYTVAL